MFLKMLPDESMQKRQLLAQMASVSEDRGYVLRSQWIRDKGWLTAPVEEAGHFTDEEIEAIVTSVTTTGDITCFAIGADDLPPPHPNAFRMTASTEDFRAFNSECGVFRFILTDEDLSWVIACNEWFNLFAGPRTLLEQMIGKTVEEAKADFLDYARMIEGEFEGGGLVRIAHEFLLNSSH